MLVLAAFVSISVAAILFLLRFLFAFFPAARRVPGRVEQVPLPTRWAGVESAPWTLDSPWLTSIPHGMLCMRRSAACSGVPRYNLSGKGV